MSVPRNFKLLDELEDAEKGKSGSADISLGLSNPDDTYMHDWQASIFQGTGGGEPRIWSLVLYADDKYPTAPPKLRFISKINADFVDAKGVVLPSRVPSLMNWTPQKTLMNVLIDLKSLIARASRSQPSEISKY